MPKNVMVIMIPDIESVNWGRGVGYEMNEFTPPENIGWISATGIRKSIKDGNEEITVEVALIDFVVTKCIQCSSLLHPIEHDFFETCREKLNWSLSKDEK